MSGQRRKVSSVDPATVRDTSQELCSRNFREGVNNVGPAKSDAAQALDFLAFLHRVPWGYVGGKAEPLLPRFREDEPSAPTFQEPDDFSILLTARPSYHALGSTRTKTAEAIPRLTSRVHGRVQSYRDTGAATGDDVKLLVLLASWTSRRRKLFSQLGARQFTKRAACWRNWAHTTRAKWRRQFCSIPEKLPCQATSPNRRSSTELVRSTH